MNTQTLIESYLNGNISHVKGGVKKLSKDKRKALYVEAKDYSNEAANFFFNLI